LGITYLQEEIYLWNGKATFSIKMMFLPNWLENQNRGTMEIALKKPFFPEREGVFASQGRLRCSLFLYSTGVEAVRIENELGHIIMLPFKGQQIWDAVFHGRRLAMESVFPEPRNVSFFFETYGCFLMHCGALRMGCPGPEDDHPLHGELPYAEYNEASIIIDEDEKGRFAGVTGVYRYRRAFGDLYDARPCVKLYEESSVLDVSITIENVSEYPMELMYMCHINFLPVENGRIVQGAAWDRESMKLRTSIPQHVQVSEEFLKLLHNVEEDPHMTETLNPDYEFNPEIVFFIYNLKTDSDGNSYFLQVLPDGSADYIKYNARVLDRAVRWIVLTKNQRALGIVLPSTAEPEGYTAEKRKGNIKQLGAKQSITFSVETGCVNSSEARKVEELIRSL
jgi:hypothetical protein